MKYLRAKLRAVCFIGATSCISAPALATADSSGYVGLSFETRDVNLGPVVDGDGLTIRADGAFVVGLGGRFNLQVDGAYSRTDWNSLGHPLGDQGILAGGAHIFYRNDHFSAGIFGGYAKLWEEAGPNDTRFGGGVEANAYIGPVTLGAVYGKFDAKGPFGGDLQGVDLTARVFPTDNFAVRAKYSYADVNFPGFDIGPRGMSLSVEYQPGKLPFSFEAGVARQRIGDFDVTFRSAYVGLRYNFGTQNLKQRDREGASAQPVTELFFPR
jgi:hypothetical protein